MERLAFISSAKHLGLQLEFPSDPDLVAGVARLAAAEQAAAPSSTSPCNLTPDALGLTVRAPETAHALLTELFGAKV